MNLYRCHARAHIPCNRFAQANKDKKHKLFPEHFEIELLFEKPTGDITEAVPGALTAIGEACVSEPMHRFYYYIYISDFHLHIFSFISSMRAQFILY